jgi:biopolymer transport protein ExbB
MPINETVASGAGSVSSALGLQSFLASTDAVGLTVFFILTGMSVLSWCVVLEKSVVLALLRLRGARVVREFWEAGSLAEALAALERRGGHDPFAELIRHGAGAATHYRRLDAHTLGESLGLSDFLTRTLRQTIARESGRLGSGLTLLASVGSVSPFVGLFGTVWGIYHAMARIGVTGKATLDQVAGPVGESLIMTAFGLAVAIPAVLGYNAFVRINRMILADLDGLAHDLHAFLTMGARLETGQALAKEEVKLDPKGEAKAEGTAGSVAASR